MRTTELNKRSGSVKKSLIVFFICIVTATAAMIASPDISLAQHNNPVVTPDVRASYSVSPTVRLGQPGPPQSGLEIWTGVVQNFQNTLNRDPKDLIRQPPWADR